MRSKKYTFPIPFSHHRPLACAILVAIAVGASWVSAQQPMEPTWRQGVSRWNGSGYALPTDSSAVPNNSATPPSYSAVPRTTAVNSSGSSPSIPQDPVISEAPYTVPVDPSAAAAELEINQGTVGPQFNPYAQLPSSDTPTSLQLTSPSDRPADTSGSATGIVLPNPHAVASPNAAAATEKNVTELVGKPVDAANRLSGDPEQLPAPPELPQVDVEALPTPPQPDASESMGEKIETEAVVETAPLEPDVTRWYQYPRRWLRGWNSHAEFGLDGSTGNARTLAIQTGLETKRQTDLYTLALDVDYRQASNRGTTTEDNGRFNLDYDRLLLDSPWSGFGKYGMEWDKFKAFDLRVWMNGGVGYYWVRRDDATLVTRFGAGASREIGAPDDDWIPEAVFGGEAERQLTSRQKIKGKVDYFPAWEDFTNFRLVSDVSWEILLDDTDNLSLKLAATDRYDSTPQGAKKNDLYYSLLLLYKF